MASEIPNNHKSLDTEEADVSLPLLTPSCKTLTHSTELHGYLLMALSCIFSASMSTFVQVAEQKFNYPILSTLFVRGFVQTVLVFLYIAVFLPFPETFSSLSQKKVKLLALRGLLASIGLHFFFASLKKLPLGEAVTIFHCTPIITMILSNIVLQEPITFIDCIAAVVCFTGVFLVARPQIGISSAGPPHDRIIGSLYSIISAFLFSISDVTVRSLGTSIHHMVSVFSFSFILTFQTILTAVATSAVEFWNFRTAGALAALIAALISLPALACDNRGLQLCRAGPGSMMTNLSVPFSYILGILFLNESPSLLRMFGSMLVIIGTLIIGLRQILKS